MPDNEKRLVFTDAGWDDLEKLRQKTGFSTKFEAVARALRLMQDAFDRVERGEVILVSLNGRLREYKLSEWFPALAKGANSGSA